MQDEITASNAAVAQQFQEKLLQQSEADTLSIAIAEHDKNTGETNLFLGHARERKEKINGR